MTSTTFTEFGLKTDGSVVAAAFTASIKGRTILITGVNKLGIGYATVQAFASQFPRCLILTGRSEAKLQECLDSLRQEHSGVEFRSLILDLSSQKSVRMAASQLLGWEDMPTIDIIINNAGVMNIPERKLSEDGIELQFATNHVGHFLFTNLIMAKIIASAKSTVAGMARIVNISSLATVCSPLRASDVNWETPTAQLPESEKPNIAMMKMTGLIVDEEMSYIPMGAYGQSKTANVLYSVGLNNRLYEKYGVLSISLHPGEVRSEIHRTTDPVWLAKTREWKKKLNLEWKTAEQGTSTILVAALDPKLGRPNSEGYGQFLSDCQIATTSPRYTIDNTEAQKLWEITEVLVKERFCW
jgi:NAD(P)-dependent dehydrogenase (short-subunit alcohol dehydrogenase family)